MNPDLQAARPLDSVGGFAFTLCPTSGSGSSHWSRHPEASPAWSGSSLSGARSTLGSSARDPRSRRFGSCDSAPTGRRVRPAPSWEERRGGGGVAARHGADGLPPPVLEATGCEASRLPSRQILRGTELVAQSPDGVILGAARKGGELAGSATQELAEARAEVVAHVDLDRDDYGPSDTSSNTSSA